MPRALPPWRYVPGLQPHPRLGGHGGAAVRPDDPPEQAWVRGLDLLAHRYPWEAHEAFELAWRAWRGERVVLAEASAGLAKVGACWLRCHAGDTRAAERLIDRAGAQVAPLGDPSLDALIRQTRAFVEGADWPTWPAPVGWPERLTDA